MKVLTLQLALFFFGSPLLLFKNSSGFVKVFEGICFQSVTLEP